jgi:uncharacterized protein YunC (DUF1805 family)
MIQQTVPLIRGEGTGYVIPAGPVNLVHVVARRGMVGCGAFDVGALANFGYPAARVRPAQGESIATIDDLLEGIVKEANTPAEEIGIRVGMTGREALDLLC